MLYNVRESVFIVDYLFCKGTNLQDSWHGLDTRELIFRAITLCYKMICCLLYTGKIMVASWAP